MGLSLELAEYTIINFWFVTIHQIISIAQILVQGFEGGEFALTGFTLKALKSYESSFEGLTVKRHLLHVVVYATVHILQIDRQISRAASYLTEVWRNYTSNKEELCSYGIALAACALAEQPIEKSPMPLEELTPRLQPESSARSEMIEELKTRIQRESGKESTKDC